MVCQVGYRLIQIMRYFRGIDYLGLGCTIHPQYSKSRSLDDKMTDKMITHAIDLIFLRWCEHDRQTLFYTLITMLQGKSATPQTLSKCYDIPINQILQAHETDRYDVDESNNVIDVFWIWHQCGPTINFYQQHGHFQAVLRIDCANHKPFVRQIVSYTFGGSSILSRHRNPIQF